MKEFVEDYFNIEFNRAYPRAQKTFISNDNQIGVTCMISNTIQQNTYYFVDILEKNIIAISNNEQAFVVFLIDNTVYKIPLNQNYNNNQNSFIEFLYANDRTRDTSRENEWKWKCKIIINENILTIRNNSFNLIRE